MSGVILGSASPRRKELLAVLIGEDFAVRTAADFEEPLCPAVESLAEVAAFVGRLAEAKSDAVFATLPDAERGRVLLTADTVVSTEGDPPRVLEKPPEDEAYAATVREWLRVLSGRWHSVFTGVCVRSGDRRESRVVRTRVRFAELDPRTIDWYVGTGEPRGKAGGYAIQGRGGLLVDGLEGSFSNVVGLPLAETRAMLDRFLSES